MSKPLEGKMIALQLRAALERHQVYVPISERVDFFETWALQNEVNMLLRRFNTSLRSWDAQLYLKALENHRL